MTGPYTFDPAGGRLLIADDLSNTVESVQAVAEKFGVCRPTLYNWKNQLLGPEAPSPMKRKNSSPAAPEREELERQLDSLQRDIRQLQIERDLLKRANELLKKAWALICNS